MGARQSYSFTPPADRPVCLLAGAYGRYAHAAPRVETWDGGARERRYLGDSILRESNDHKLSIAPWTGGWGSTVRAAYQFDRRVLLEAKGGIFLAVPRIVDPPLLVRAFGPRRRRSAAGPSRPTALASFRGPVGLRRVHAHPSFDESGHRDRSMVGSEGMNLVSRYNTKYLKWHGTGGRLADVANLMCHLLDFRAPSPPATNTAERRGQFAQLPAEFQNSICSKVLLIKY